MPKDVMCQRACRPPLRQSNFRDRVYGKTSVPTARSVEHSEIRSCSTPAERTRKPSRTVLPIFRRRKPEVRPWGVRVKSPAQLAHQWRCRRPPSLEYIPSLGATTRTCSFPCFGCTGRRLRPWLRRLAPVRTPRSNHTWVRMLRRATMEGTRLCEPRGFWILARQRKPL